MALSKCLITLFSEGESFNAVAPLAPKLVTLMFTLDSISSPDSGSSLKVTRSQKDPLCYSVKHKSIPPNILLKIRLSMKIESNPCYPRICEANEQEWEKKNQIFLNFEYWNLVVSKKVNFSNPPILNIFSPKFQEMVLG